MMEAIKISDSTDNRQGHQLKGITTEVLLTKKKKKKKYLFFFFLLLFLFLFF